MFKKITDSIYIVSTTDSGAAPLSYSFFIDDEKKTLIDTPLDYEFANYFNNQDIDLIINTHFHRDHAGCNHLFPAAKIMAHSLDIPPLESREAFLCCYGFDLYGHPELKDLPMPWLDYNPCHVDEELFDGKIIHLGKTDLEVIHTPGHTPGHCALYNREEGILFAGDIDLASFGPWYGNTTSNVDELIRSIKRIIDLNPRVILSAHKGVIDKNIQTRLKNYLNRIYETEEKILSALTKPLTLEELTNKKIIYRHWLNPPEMFAFLERVCITVHLRRLLRLGVVQYCDGHYELTQNTSYQTAIS